jgi:hypothetical protein
MVASLACWPLYLGLYALMPRLTFGYLVAVAGGSSVLAAGHHLGLPLEWTAVSLVILSIGHTAVASRLGAASRWRALARALDVAAQAITPVVLLALLTVRLAGWGPSDHVVSEYAVGAAWWLGVVYYAATAWLFGRRPLWHVAAWLGPAAYLLTLTRMPWGGEWYGLCLALLGLGYLIGSWWGRRRGLLPGGPDWRRALGAPPFPVAGALSVVAAGWMAPPQAAAPTFALLGAGYALATIVLGYRALAYVSVYALVGVAVELNAWLQPPTALRVAGAIGQACVALAGAEWLVRRTGEARRPFVETVVGLGSWRSRYGPPLFGLGYLASLVALVQSSVLVGDHTITTVALGAILALWAVSAVLRRTSVLQYPVACLAPIWLGEVFVWVHTPPNILALAAARTGLALVSIALANRLGRTSGASAWPWLLLGYALAVLAPLSGFQAPELADRWPAALWLLGVGLVYLAGLLPLRRPGWLYPAVGFSLLAYLGVLDAIWSIPVPVAASALIGPMWLLGVLAHLVERHRPVRAARWPHMPSLALLAHPWARPLAIGGVVSGLLAVVGGLDEPAAGLATAAASAALLGLLAVRRRGRVEAGAAGALAALAYQQLLRLAQVPLATQPLAWSAIALLLSVGGLALGSRIEPVHLRTLRLMTLWITGLSVAASLVGRAADPLAANLGLAGLTWVVQGYAGRRWELGYVGVGLVIGGVLVELGQGRLAQPQAYALMVGLYLLGVAYLEWRRGSPTRVKALLEITALAVILGTSVLQAWGWAGDGLSHYVYAVLLLGEGVALVWLGAILRWRRTFFAAIGGVVVASLTLVAEPVSAVNTWYILASVGLGMIGVVLFLEKRRQQVQGWLGAWRQALEQWD